VAGDAELLQHGETWWSTVRIDSTSFAAISALVRPAAIMWRISTWRSVSPAGFARVVGLGPRGTWARPRSPTDRAVVFSVLGDRDVRGRASVIIGGESAPMTRGAA
jgi:hypothetical protein